MSWSRAKLSFFLVGGLVLLTAVCLVRAIAAAAAAAGGRALSTAASRGRGCFFFE